jgi:hypothetical protein
MSLVFISAEKKLMTVTLEENPVNSMMDTSGLIFLDTMDGLLMVLLLSRCGEDLYLKK